MTTWRHRMRRLRRPALLGTLRRTRPLSAVWGRDRGTPVDRWYIESFLGEHATDVRGRVLEVLDATYARRFGGDQLASVDVLDIDASNAQATIIADLQQADGVPDASFDTIILTQVLQFLADPRRGLAESWRLLAPGGTLLLTVPTVSRLSPRTAEADMWRFTPAGLRQLAASLPGASVEVTGRGNVLAGIAFLAGMAIEELRPRERTDDPLHPVIVTLRAVKSGG